MISFHLHLKSQLLFCLMLASTAAFSQHRILIDEIFSDWDGIPPNYTDAIGEANGTDLLEWWIHSDAEYLFFRFSLDEEINFQDQNDIALYIDTDFNEFTGQAEDGIGADLIYYFGAREGQFGFGGQQSIYQNDIGLVSSPTVSSTEFEWAIRRDQSLFGQQVFPLDSIRLIIKNEAAGGDQMPDQSGGLVYHLLNHPPGVLPEFSFAKKDNNHLRVISYNVLADGLWESGRSAAFQRILRAVDPDIIAFQEIYSHTAGQTKNWVESALQNQWNGTWHFEKVGPDLIIVSKYEIFHYAFIEGNAAFVLDLGTKQLLLFNAHPPCCDNNTQRQFEIDAMMAFLRNVKNGTASFSLPANSPIVIVGDMNLVGFKRQQETLLTGDILDNATFGPDFSPDWDGSALKDSKPYTTGKPMAYTWYRTNSSFSPGRLDYIVYSGSELQLENQFTLFTPALSSAELSVNGLQWDDAIVASDHLPLVADFNLDPMTAVDSELEDDIRLILLPNPAMEITACQFVLKKPNDVQLTLFNLSGQQVLKHDVQFLPIGKHQILLETADVPAGIYLLGLKVGEKLLWKKLEVQ